MIRLIFPFHFLNVSLLLGNDDKRKTLFLEMIPSLMILAVRVLGKYFLVMESLRYLPDEIVQMIFNEYLKHISHLSILNEKDLLRIVNLLTDYHADVFCTSLCYSKSNLLNFLPPAFYLHLLKRLQNHLIQLDFSNGLEKFNPEEKMEFLNLIGQMEQIEYLRLTHNHLDDDDIRILTASNRIRSKPLCNLHHLHLQGKKIEGNDGKENDVGLSLPLFVGNHLTSRSARFLKALTSLDTLYVSHLSSYVNRRTISHCFNQY